MPAFYCAFYLGLAIVHVHSLSHYHIVINNVGHFCFSSMMSQRLLKEHHLEYDFGSNQPKNVWFIDSNCFWADFFSVFIFISNLTDSFIVVSLLLKCFRSD